MAEKRTIPAQEIEWARSLERDRLRPWARFPKDGEIFEALVRMREEGIALLLVEQNVRRAASISTSCYVMEKGTIIAHGEPAAILADASIRQRLSI